MKRFVPSHIVNKLVSELTLLCALEEVGSFLRRPCVGFVGSEGPALLGTSVNLLQGSGQGCWIEDMK